MSGLLPPGVTSLPAASRTLVLAPHYDDETFGCGGLLALLAAAGTTVRTVFLTDGGGDLHDPAERRAYSELRQQEARRALEALGLDPQAVAELGLRDGQSEATLEVLAQALAAEIEAFEPDLVLCPSPLEVTPDHQAAFAALHRVLSGEVGQEIPAAAPRILLYEVNHPAYPDVLVDVTSQKQRLVEAVACYPSQLEKHDYEAAAMGLRRYRTLSLPAAVELAEGYRSLEVGDFRTRSWPTLVRHLGGVPPKLEVVEGLLLSVVVRTRNRPELLAEALASLARSSYPRVEVCVVNDGGTLPELPGEFPFPLERVDLEENRGRAVAAQTGVEHARGQALCFLDDDDLVEPEHLATLAGLLSGAGVRVGYVDAAVVVYEADEKGWREAERRLPYSRDFDADRLLLDNFIPFHTLVFERNLLDEVGAFDPSLPFFEDWDLLIRAAQRTPFHHLARVTCEYRHFRGAGHHILGNDPRSRADFLAMKARIYAKHRQLLGPELLARAIDDLRAEAVELREEATHAKQGRRRAEEDFHRQRGELETLRADRDRRHGLELSLREDLARHRDEIGRQSRELERVYGEEKRLHELAEGRRGEIESLYAEIQRLGQVIGVMESSRAWRLSRWLSRWRS